MNILTLNVGSSSVKYRVFDVETLTERSGGKVEGLLPHGTPTHKQAIESILAETTADYAAVIHRVVHGGPDFKGAVLLDDDIVDQLDEFTPFAPLHQPHNLSAIRIIQKMRPDMPQYACFDTAFHRGHDALFDTYALPKSLRDMGLRRFGFHGLSYQYIAGVLQRDHPALFSGRVIVAHLGNGASLCAIKNGISIDSTMGLTAIDGIPMGTRAGNIDPGLVLYLTKDLQIPPEEIEDMLYNQSGLLGLSEISNDVKILLQSTDKRAKFALDFFSLKVAQAIASLAVSLGGVDAIVFTGGIGENAAHVRDSILNRVAHLGTIPHLVIKTNEELVMAQELEKML